MRARYLLIGFYITIVLGFFVQSVNLTTTDLTANTTNECNNCHGPTHLGHVAYTISLGISETILNGTISILTATIVNSNFPLTQSSIVLQETADYKFQPLNTSDSITKTLGTLDRGSTTVVSWNIMPVVTTNKSTPLQVNFQGTASDHKIFTYTNTVSKTVFVSTAKIALLQVQSTPLSDTSYLQGDVVNNASLSIKNNGVIGMTNVAVNTTGNVLVNSKKNFVIDSVDPGSQISFPIEIDTALLGPSSITITYANSTPIQQVIILVNVLPIPPTPFSLTLGRIIGYITYTLLFLSVVAGTGVFHLKKYISGRKIRILHADLSNLSFTMAIIHAVILTLPSSTWFGTYDWFELIPQSLTWSLTIEDLGLEIGRWTLVLMYIGVISGYYIALIIKKLGRSVGISVHMLSYLALILGMVHATIIGGFAKTFVLIPIIMFISILSIGWLKYDAKVQLKRRKAERALKRKELTAKPVSSTDKTTSHPVFTSSHRKPATIQHQTGVVCSNCSTINEDDAFFCKKCAYPLEGQICSNCQVRNPLNASLCLACKKKLTKKGALN